MFEELGKETAQEVDKLQGGKEDATAQWLRVSKKPGFWQAGRGSNAPKQHRLGRRPSSRPAGPKARGPPAGLRGPASCGERGSRTARGGGW